MNKSEDQAKNEEIVRKIMEERGYNRKPAKKRESIKDTDNKSFAPVGTFFAGLMIIALGWFFVYNSVKDNITKNNSDSVTAKPSISEEPSSKEDVAQKAENNESNKIVEQTGTPTNTEPQKNAVSPNTSKNSNTDAKKSTESYTDRSPRDPHACDKEKEAYDTVYNGLDSFYKAYLNAYESQTPYIELYEMYGKNQAVATEKMKKEQENVQILFNVYKEQQNLSNELYYKWLECRKAKL